MKKNIILTICAISLMSASCNFFGPTTTAGVLKTSNGGVDWQASNKIKDSSNYITDLAISRMAFDPQGADVIYLSSFSGGMYKSLDGGGSWEQILGTIPIIDFAINPYDSKTIYAGGNFEDKARALVTRDGGKSWNAVYTGGTAGGSVRAISLNPNNPQQILIGLSQGELIASGDGGGSWKLLQSYNDRINKIIWNNDGIYVVIKGTGISKSIDGGASFKLITAGLQSAGNISNLSIFGSAISAFNQMAISATNSSVVYVTTNLGLYSSTDAGNTWKFISMPLRQSAAVPMAVAIAPSSENVVYVSAGSIVYKTTDSGSSWSTADTGTGSLINALLVDPTLPQVAYAGAYK